MERAQLRPGLDADLLDEHAARVAVGLERLGLAPAAVEREHQLAGEPLARRVLGDEPPQLARPARRGGRRRASASTRNSRAASRCSSSRAISAWANGSYARSASGGPRQSSSASRSSAAASSACPAASARAPLLDQPLEALGVELARAHAQRGSRPASSRRCPLAERLAQPRDVDLHGSHGPAGASSPHSASASRSALTGSFACSSRTASTARGFGLPALRRRLAAHLKRSEDPELHVSGRRYPPSGAFGKCY